MKYDPNIIFKPPNQSRFKIGDKVTIISNLYGPPYNKYSNHFIIDIGSSIGRSPYNARIYRIAKTLDTPETEGFWFPEQHLELIRTP